MIITDRTQVPQVNDKMEQNKIRPQGPNLIQKPFEGPVPQGSAIVYDILMSPR